MPKRQFVQLSYVYDPSRHRVNGWYWSEKLDGERGLWLPRTRGKRLGDVPFANLQRSGSPDDLATGLWTRLGKPIYCPDWWLDRLPNWPADGELYLGRGLFNELRSIVSRTVNRLDCEWEDVSYTIFDIPSAALFDDGLIDTPHYTCRLDGAYNWYGASWFSGTFDANLAWLAEHDPTNSTVRVHKQTRLPMGPVDSVEACLDAACSEVLALGGEGLVLRDPSRAWVPERTYASLKVKPYLDDECVLVGYTGGEGRHAGRIGAFICEYRGVRFNLSGMTDKEREVHVGTLTIPGASYFSDLSPSFKLGDQLTFRYRELRSGVPVEGRYLRPR